MKKIKKYIFSLMCLYILSFAIVVEAGTINDSTGGSGAGHTGGSCPNCSWIYESSSDSGVRISLYKYNGSGKPQKCGNTLDLFNANKTEVTGAQQLVSGQLSRFDYTHGGKKVEFNIGTIKGQSIKQYNDGYTYLLTEPWGPTFINNLKEYLGDNNEQIKKNISLMFGYEIDIKQASQYYLTVEPTMNYYNRTKGVSIYGTAYEIIDVLDVLNQSQYKGSYGYNFSTSVGNTVVVGMNLNAMYVKKDEMKKYNLLTGSYDKYNFVNHDTGKNGLIVAADNIISPRAGSLDKAVANHSDSTYAYGITVLWLDDMMTPPSRTCKSYCSGYSGTALNNCAEQFCTANSNDSDCIATCFDIVYDSPGCPRETKNTCYNESLGTNIKANPYCASTGSTANQELSSNICYDDVDDKDYKTESLVVTKGTNSIYVNEASTPGKISYYKIECSENVKFKNLPTQSNVYVSNALTSNLYLGYTMEYSKSCQIYYKTSDENWTTDYQKSRAADELKKYSNESTVQSEKGYLQIAKEQLTAKQNELAQLAGKTDKASNDKKVELEAEINRLNTVISLLQETISDLQTVKLSAEGKIKKVKEKDQSDTGALTNEVQIEISNNEATSSSTKTITLVPVYCIANKTSTSQHNYCDLEEKQKFTINTLNNTTCLNNNQEQKAIFNSSTGKSTYSETVYYSLPSSYVGITKVGSTVVCRDKDCLTANNVVSSDEIKYAWVFDPLNSSVSLDAYNSVIGTNNIKLIVKGMGSCGQFSLDLTCDYKFESSTICTKDCIDEYHKAGSSMTTAEYEACFKEHCSCDSYCGSNIVCRTKYCPNNRSDEDIDLFIEPCEDGNGSCTDSCSDYVGKDQLTCAGNCCRLDCNGHAGCIFECCTTECQRKYENGYITKEEYELCNRMCRCENGSCPEAGGRNYVYRTVNLNRPFPDGDNVQGRTPGANWFGKVEYITQSEDAGTKYHDTTDGRSSEYEYRFVLTAENIKTIKANNDINLTYTIYKESKNARNTYEEQSKKNKNTTAKVNVYCSYIIHDYFKELGINATSNSQKVKNQNIVGSGCYTQ